MQHYNDIFAILYNDLLIFKQRFSEIVTKLELIYPIPFLFLFSSVLNIVELPIRVIMRFLGIGCMSLFLPLHSKQGDS